MKWYRETKTQRFEQNGWITTISNKSDDRPYDPEGIKIAKTNISKSVMIEFWGNLILLILYGVGYLLFGHF